MLFNSLHYLLFLPVVIFLYYLVKPSWRWALIIIASCYFYMAFVPEYILILFLLIFIDFYAALKIEAAPVQKKKHYLIYSLISNIGLLVFFKFNYTININLAYLLKDLGVVDYIYVTKILLPLGLSFHTFQSMSYTIEVYRGRQKAETHLGYYASYVLFFPQMVAGPIERYSSLGMQLHETHAPNYENFARGFRLILYGLFVKMVIADNLAPLVNEVYADPMLYSTRSVLTAILFFSFQIYADFYGYSMIACGSALLMGISLMQNFKAPYLAKSIADFWQRWHISLSTWFRDYLFIPLGGSRVSKSRLMLNILLVFGISGLWHGSTLNFMIWGLLHGILYLIENRFTKQNVELTESKAKLAFRRIFTFAVVSLCWIFFRSDSFEKTKSIFTSLSENLTSGKNLDFAPQVILLFFAFVIFDFMLKGKPLDQWMQNKGMAARWGIYTVLLFCLFYFGGIQYVPFIYFQF